MQNAMRVTIRDALKHLKQVGLDKWQWQAVLHLIHLHVLLEIEIEILEDEKEPVVGVNDIEKLDDVQVVELFEQRDLAYRCRRHAVHFGVEPDAFERHCAACAGVACSVHHAVCAFAYFFNP